MIYVLVALEAELPRKFFYENMPKNCEIVYTGVGKVNAAIAVTSILAKANHTKIINYGTAGTLTPELAGQLLEVGAVYQRDMDARPQAPLGSTPFEDSQFHAGIVLSNSNITLSTGDNFVTSTPELVTDLVDMEAYALAKACRRFKTNFTCVKYASDFADENAAAAWAENVSNGADKFVEWFKN
jgi:adenosylhomocysteine nucleosidase|tara:strand:+ start:691 stop:1242 length:552 start_codon:yes stop_codon:yes gene_type:complete